MFKRFLALAMALILSVSNYIFAYHNDESSELLDFDKAEFVLSDVSIECPEYPDAYIEQTFLPATRSADNTVGTIIATVYVEEGTYIDENGEKTPYSRLLSEKEKSGELAYTNGTRGKLTTEFTVRTVGTNKYTLEMENNWDGSGWFPTAENYPAKGDDYMGFVWGGQFDVSNLRSSLENPAGGSGGNAYLADSTPNSAVVWGFAETFGTSGATSSYVKKANCQATLNKNTLTGSGNTTSFVCKYIHTYESHNGSISISASSGGVSGGFSLSGVSKQWSLVCNISGFKY